MLGTVSLEGRRVCWVWLSCGGGWWALAAGGVRAIARGINEPLDNPWTIESCWLVRQGKQVDQTAGLGFLSRSV